MEGMIEIIIMALGLLLAAALAYAALSGPSASKEGGRRLQSVRFRHSQSAKDRVEAQYRLVRQKSQVQAHGWKRWNCA